MRPEAITKEYQRAYHSLVDYVEEQVVKEGKTLQQALHSTEETLSEWNELSKEQVQELNTALKHDFQKLGESLKGAREAYKEQFKLDAAYVTDSIWGQFLSVIDTSTAQFAAFEKDLKEQVQEIVTGEHLNEHQQHTQWKSDHELWLSEIALWKKQHTGALAKLEEIGKSIIQQSNLLDEHAQVIQSHEARDHEHEAVIADAEQDPSSQVFGAADETSVSMHEQEKQEHQQHAELHESMKKHHLKVMTLVSELYKKTV